MALHNIGGNIGGAVAYSVAALLATWLGWREAIIAMIIGGAFATVIFGMSYRQMPTTNDEDKTQETEEQEIAATEDRKTDETDAEPTGFAFHHTNIWIPVLIVAFAALLSGAFSRGLNTFLPTFLTTIRGTSGAVAGMLSTIMLLSGAGGSFLGGKLGDMWSRKRIVLISALVTALFVVVMVQFPLQGIPLILVLIAIGFSLSVARPCLNALTSNASPSGKTGTAFGIVFGVMSLGGSAATPVIGYITDNFTLQLGFFVLAIFFLAHGLLMQAVKTD